MYRFALLFVLFSVVGIGCDSSDSAPEEQPFPEENVDDGSVSFGNVYVADVSGTDASFFRINNAGVCTAASLRLDFAAGRLELACTTVRDGETVLVNPEGPFRYELRERTMSLRSNFGYTMEATAPTDGRFIEGVITRTSSGQTVDVLMLMLEVE